jgi:hypothetical protein
MKLCFIDTETTSLDDRQGRIWEVGLIVREYPGPEYTDTEQEFDFEDTEYLWQLPVCLEWADPMSLKIGGFHQRRWPSIKESYEVIEGHKDAVVDGALSYQDGAGIRTYDPLVLHPDWMPEWAEHFVKLTEGSHLVGNVTSFDEERLRYLLRSLHQCQAWHYHLVDVENFIAGCLHLPPPWRSDELSEAIGVPVPEDRHGALPDARWARDMYDAVLDTQMGDYVASVRRGLLVEREERNKT